MSDLISLSLMISMPLLLFMGVKARMRKDAGWKKYLFAAGSAFLTLVVITKFVKI